MKKNLPFVKMLKGAKKFKRLFGSSDKKKGLSSGLMALKKGESVGTHNTGSKEEILFILSGSALVCLPRKDFILKTGMMLYIPPHTLHDVKNSSGRLLKYIYVTAQAI